MVLAVNVNLWGQRVGVVRWDENHRVANFVYDPEFIKTGIEVSPLKMPLSKAIYRFPELRDSNSFKALPGLLADSLPERYGNELMAVWLANRGISFDELNPVDRLCYVGTRGMGALEFEPDEDAPTVKNDDLDLDGLLSVARKIMNDKNEVYPAEKGDANLDRLIQIGTSAGGAKAKALIATDADGKLMSGQGQVPAGFKHYLLKFSDVANSEHQSDVHVGRVEMAYHYMAVYSGINMMPCRLIETSDGAAHFMTERFDRDSMGNKFHVQTFCGLAHEDRDPVGMSSYERLFSVARQLGLKQKAVAEIFRRMVFNIVTRNQDDHTKNHAFMMDSTGTWQLTPAYDLCFAFKKNSVWIDKHQLNCNGKRDDFTLADIQAAANAADVKNYKKVLNDVYQAVGFWSDFAERVGLPVDVASAIKSHFRTLE